MSNPAPRVALVTLGCARNEVDTEELAARLGTDGWQVGTDATDADVVMINTCGFIEQAKQESVDILLAAADSGAKVVAVGCLAERYGKQLADSLPEADAVLGFDDYPEITARLASVLAGERPASHEPRDRRTLLPLAPTQRRGTNVSTPGHGANPAGDGALHLPIHLRGMRRLSTGPSAPLKLASGCDRRCTFCAIPRFRGAFISRTPDEVVAEARWLAEQGVRELVLVSENSTSYGKDLGDPKALETLLPRLAAVDGVARIQVSYLQPAELRPSLIEAIASIDGVAPYFDLSFQHASEPVLRRMRRFGSVERFVELLETVRRHAPEAGVRSNVIVGFPGETRADVAELRRFLEAARMDAIGVFRYSDEDGTEAVDLPGKVRPDTIDRRWTAIAGLAEELTAQRAEERVGDVVDVLVESVEGLDGAGGGTVEGRAAFQGLDDGATTVRLEAGVPAPSVGEMVTARVVAAEGVDLIAQAGVGLTR